MPLIGLSLPGIPSAQVPLPEKLKDSPLAGLVSVDPDLVRFARFLLDRPQIKDNNVLRGVVKTVRRA
jgi:hypothetical protein